MLDDERLKQGNRVFGKDYFEELLERIREIRASERRFYQKITDIYALSVGLRQKCTANKGVLRHGAEQAALGNHRENSGGDHLRFADAKKIYMGLTNWKHAPDGKILKSDVSVAKNYLNEAHIKELNRIVSAYLDLAENRAQRSILMKMAGLGEFLHGFLELSSYPILKDKGRSAHLKQN